MKQKITDFGSVKKFLEYVSNNKAVLTGISRIRLMLLKESKTETYLKSVFDEIMKYLKNSKNVFEQYALLQLLEGLPSNILTVKGYPLYKIYRFLIDGAMVLANYNEAKIYIDKISKINETGEDYYLNLVYAKKMASNINGLQMKMDDAISVGLDAISILETYFNSYNSIDRLFNEHILLYDRVAIEYYMAGQYHQCEKYHKIAQTMLRDFNAPYVKYHILYEQGVRELHNNIEEGIEHIQESLQNIPTYDFMTESQEKDLIIADLLMGKLLCLKNEKELDLIKSQAQLKCNELATAKEPFESILFHWIVANCFILQHNFKEAAHYHRISVLIAAKTPILGALWKSYLNLAQVYLLMSCQEDNKYVDSYKETAKYYLMESKEIIEDALMSNVWTKIDYQKRLSYPLSLINQLLGLSEEIDTHFKPDSSLHLDFENYSFFMLD